MEKPDKLAELEALLQVKLHITPVAQKLPFATRTIHWSFWAMLFLVPTSSNISIVTSPTLQKVK